MRYDEWQQAPRNVRAAGQVFSGNTGTMAAGLVSGAHVLTARYPMAATGRFYLTWLHVHFATIVAFTTPVTAGRRLALRRGSGADASGGNALDVSRCQSDATETLLTGRVADTAALTVTGITLETEARAQLLLAQAGNAGADYDEIWRFDDPLVLLPGQLFAVVAGATFDAGGTWQANFKGGGFEVKL